MFRAWMSILILVWFAAGTAPIARAESGTRPFEIEDAMVRFVCRGPDVKVPAWGQFGAVEGSLMLDPEDLSTASSHLEVFMVSVRTDDAAWDTMFRRAGFLEIDEHPRSRFVLDEIKGADKLEPGKWVAMDLEGHFTMHGITKKVTVPATVKWLPSDADSQKHEQIRLRAHLYVTWDEYEIAMPTGSTRLFAGDGAYIHVDVKYKPASSKKKRRKKSAK